MASLDPKLVQELYEIEQSIDVTIKGLKSLRVSVRKALKSNCTDQSARKKKPFKCFRCGDVNSHLARDCETDLRKKKTGIPARWGDTPWPDEEGTVDSTVV